MDVKRYSEYIKKLKPLSDSKFKYNKFRWSKLDPSFTCLIKDFEDLEISRGDVITAFKSFYKEETDWKIPLLLTMVWGFADIGYGAYRTNGYLTEKKNRGHIEMSLNKIKNNKLEEAYNSLKKIEGLNISYISKILYFATKAYGYERYALIYDIRVARSLIKLTTSPEIFKIVNITPSSKWSHYDSYINIMHRVSKELGIEAESLEMFLFEQKFQKISFFI